MKLIGLKKRKVSFNSLILWKPCKPLKTFAWPSPYLENPVLSYTDRKIRNE